MAYTLIDYCHGGLDLKLMVAIDYTVSYYNILKYNALLKVLTMLFTMLYLKLSVMNVAYNAPMNVSLKFLSF